MRIEVLEASSDITISDMMRITGKVVVIDEAVVARCVYAILKGDRTDLDKLKEGGIRAVELVDWW